MRNHYRTQERSGPFGWSGHNVLFICDDTAHCGVAVDESIYV